MLNQSIAPTCFVLFSTGPSDHWPHLKKKKKKQVRGLRQNACMVPRTLHGLIFNCEIRKTCLLKVTVKISVFLTSSHHLNNPPSPSPTVAPRDRAPIASSSVPWSCLLSISDSPGMPCVRSCTVSRHTTKYLPRHASLNPHFYFLFSYFQGGWTKLRIWGCAAFVKTVRYAVGGPIPLDCLGVFCSL